MKNKSRLSVKELQARDRKKRNEKKKRKEAEALRRRQEEYRHNKNKMPNQILLKRSEWVKVLPYLIIPIALIALVLGPATLDFIFNLFKF